MNDKPVALLINPPIYDFALYDLYHRPYGLLRIGAWLADAGYRLEIIDALDPTDAASSQALGRPKRESNGTGKFHRQPVQFPHRIKIPDRRFARYGMLAQSLRGRIEESHPDVVLVSSGMTYWYGGVVEAVDTVKSIHPDTPVIVGGIYASLLPEHCKRVTHGDFVVAGNAGSELDKILGSLRLSVPSDPVGAQVLMAPEVWRGAGVLRLNEGCPFRCRYCASGLLCPDFSSHGPETVFEILKQMYEDLGIHHFAFYDDALLVDKERGLIPLLELVIASPMDVNLYVPNALHIRYLDEKTARLMKSAGFREIRLGYESSSETFHEDFDEKVASEELLDAIKILKVAGFSANKILVYLLAGLPGQRAVDVEESIRYTTSLGVRASLAEYSPVPGTELWESSVAASRYPIAEEPFFQNNSIFSMEWSGFTFDDLRRLKALTHELSPGTYD